MGNWLTANKEAPPSPRALVLPLFDFPPLAARTKMLESSYDLLFGKLALRCLFEDCFEEARHFSTRIMLKPIDDLHVDLIATVSFWVTVTLEYVVSLSMFRNLLMRSCAYYPKYGFGAFGFFPMLLKKRLWCCGVEIWLVKSINWSYINAVLLYVTCIAMGDEFPKSAWLVSKMGRLTAGVQYKPQFGSKDGAKYKNLANWSCAIGYGLGSDSPLSPSFNFGLELAKSLQFIASFYQHVVVQRRGILLPPSLPLSLSLILWQRVDDKPSNVTPDSTFQFAASWQANKNFLLKGKVGPFSSSVAFALKSWWKPAFTFSISATSGHTVGKTAFGFGISVDNVREASLIIGASDSNPSYPALYQRADPNFVMLTPNKEHLADGIQWKFGNRPVLQSDINSGNFDGIPRELRPLGRIL
ncbi:hypothetical protein TEA_015452 [Camellia sinensis var. sinensis]|uniref:Uncharacterized protein n=1 Tax=Camellia sinensis var. sinensis TaxID=542762 RepID=A0A4V3WQ07_CAMSN|nr:hypothetical protein TEA_015452 [Camellia sinensis var. sinensis]